jgi:hypothetical protein
MDAMVDIPAGHTSMQDNALEQSRPTCSRYKPLTSAAFDALRMATK